MLHRQRSTRRNQRRRRGAVTVEFALVAPIFLTLMLGVSQVSRIFDVQNQLAVAVREGARLAAMDRAGMLADGQTTNQKITQDVRNFLTANGLPGESVDIYIVDPNDHVSTFQLDEPANDLKLFELRVELPYSAVSSLAGAASNGAILTAKVVFRNARAAIVQ
ncbi:MAG: TadE/TadG family type IV pilus assembly protein [Pirellulales bacterium]